MWRGIEIDYAFCRAGDLHLVYDALKPRPLPMLVERSGLRCRRASNAGYFLGYGALAKHQGVLLAGGRRWHEQASQGRPTMWMLNDGVPGFGYDTNIDPSHVRWAISGGPMLVERGAVTDLAALVRLGGYVGFDERKICPEIAIGVTISGQIVHVVSMRISMADLAGFMLDCDCVDAIKMDGGGSTCLMEDGRVTLGRCDRRIPTAFVMTGTIAVPCASG